jgi:hypothetical protein
MAKKNVDQVKSIILEVEGLAKRLRTGIRQQAKALPKELNTLATRLRKRAAEAAAQVEKYVHQLRVELEGSAVKSRKIKRPARRAA